MTDQPVPDRAARRRLLAAAAAAGLPRLTHAQDAAPARWRLGLAPYLSPAALLEVFRPLREQLSTALGQPVEVFSARDFASLAAAVRQSAYELALLPAHVGRLALADWGWLPLAATVRATPVLVLVRNDGPVRSAAELRGRKVGMLDPLSLTAAVGTHWLRQQGLRPGEDVTLQSLPSINSALFALDRDEVGAVVAAASQLRSLPPATPRSERALAEVHDIPGPVYLARPGLAPDQLARLRTALLAFRPDPAHPTTAANTALTPLSAADLERVEPYAAVARQLLATPPRR